MSQADPNRPFDCADCWAGLVRCERHRLAPDKSESVEVKPLPWMTLESLRGEHEAERRRRLVYQAWKEKAVLFSEIDRLQSALAVAQRETAAITAMAQAQRDCKPPYTSWSPAGMHQMLVQLHDLILKEPAGGGE